MYEELRLLRSRQSCLRYASKNVCSKLTVIKELTKVQAPQAKTPKAISHFREYLSPKKPKTGAEAK